MISKLTDEELIKRAINVGQSLEAVDFNRKFQNYPGQPDLTKKELDRQYRNLRAKGNRLMAEMYDRKIDTESNEDLEYAVQFI